MGLEMGFLSLVPFVLCGGSEFMDCSPLGQASCCISFCNWRDASCKLGMLCFFWAWSNKFFHILPEVMSSVAWRLSFRKYAEGGAV